MTSNSFMSYVKLLVTSRIIKSYQKLSGTSFLHCTVLDGTLEHHMFFLPIFLYQHGGVNLKVQQLLLQINGKNFGSANNYLIINHMTMLDALTEIKCTAALKCFIKHWSKEDSVVHIPRTNIITE